MREIDIVKRVMDEQFEGKVLEMYSEQVYNVLKNQHGYIFKKYLNCFPDFDGSKDYFQLYCLIFGILSDMCDE